MLEALEYDVTVRMDISVAKGFSFYYVMGFYLDRVNISKKSQGILSILGVCSFITMFVGRAYPVPGNVVLSLLVAIPDELSVAFISVFLFLRRTIMKVKVLIKHFRFFLDYVLEPTLYMLKLYKNLWKL